ncbi:MAG: transposase [Chloroflexi bacterium]|nr:transposase [Chloroflexota bacterium]
MEEDECWFSRFAQPQAHAWAVPQQPWRLVEREPPRGEKHKALACFGAVRRDTHEVLLYFSQGQPNRWQQWMFIVGLLAVARAEGKQVVVIIWDNASWHKSKDLRTWIRAYNQHAKATHEPRLLTHWLPVKSPWLNPMNPAGFMPNAVFVNRMVPCHPSNYSSAYVLILIPNRFTIHSCHEVCLCTSHAVSPYFPILMKVL